MLRMRNEKLEVTNCRPIAKLRKTARAATDHRSTAYFQPWMVRAPSRRQRLLSSRSVTEIDATAVEYRTVYFTFQSAKPWLRIKSITHLRRQILMTTSSTYHSNDSRCCIQDTHCHKIRVPISWTRVLLAVKLIRQSHADKNRCLMWLCQPGIVSLRGQIDGIEASPSVSKATDEFRALSSWWIIYCDIRLWDPEW